MLHFTMVKVQNMKKKNTCSRYWDVLCSDSTPSCDIAVVTGVKYKAIYKFAYFSFVLLSIKKSSGKLLSVSDYFVQTG